MKKSFEKVLDDIQYLSIENTKEKSRDEVADEIRSKIREYGWPCCEDMEDPSEWLEKHPWIAEQDCEFSAVEDMAFLCRNEYDQIHDIAWEEFEVNFYGIWGESGTFIVE